MIKEATSKPSNPEALQTFVDDYIVDAGFKQGDTAELVLTANKSANVVKIRVERDGDIIKTFVNDKEACSRNVKSNVNISI
ncbi:MAG: hypothetical protein WCG25_10125 [bacterium]